MSERMHYGRAWHGHEIEDACPCHKAACGLVDGTAERCPQHGLAAARTMRQGHLASSCPGAL